MKAVLLGTGWRSQFFVRIARLVPSVLEITAIYTHTEERARELERNGLSVTSDLDRALSAPHDAVIVASGRNGFFGNLRLLHDNGEKIIAETTFLSLGEEELSEVEDYGGLVMEQYQHTPLFASVIASLPRAGKIDQLYLSGLHNHHSAAIARKILSIGHDLPDEISSIDYPSRIVRTGSRAGLDSAGEMEDYERRIRIMKFRSSLFIHDFSSNQYHSYLYGKKLEIRGSSGIITESGVNSVDDRGYPVSIPFVFHRDASKGNGALTLSHVTLGGRTLFVNPYYPLAMNDDEIAMTMMLERYGKGEDPYPFREGVADARLGKLL